MKFCKGRRRYESKGEASAAGLRRPKSALLRYHCARCGGWHLGE